jgi:hypothetical protein
MFSVLSKPGVSTIVVSPEVRMHEGLKLLNRADRQGLEATILISNMVQLATYLTCLV